MNITEYAIEKNAKRLSGTPYTSAEVFRPDSYDWPGDWEGRALLAFACHFRMGIEIPCMKEMLVLLPEKTGEKGYFGKPFDENLIDEQQLAGQNWLLRGLLESDKNGVKGAREKADKLVEGLYLPALPHYVQYPVGDRSEKGGVSGNGGLRKENWSLSTDIGCLFISLDGLAEYYKVTADERVGTWLKKAIDRFASLDFTGMKMQTHATLSALRGVLTFYERTGEKKYLEIVRRIFDLYIREGMTLTYENYNWFTRKDTWTEPCAVVDSLILAIRLYKFTGEEFYKKLARRIRFNGLIFCLRSNGGAGPNTCVTEAQPYLKISMYEAPFCCTMRYAEGLLYMFENEELFSDGDKEIRFENGRYFRGDRLLVEDTENLFPENEHFETDAGRLIEIPSLGETDEESALKICLKVYFGG